MSKHFVNNPTNIVNSALQAVRYTNPSLIVDASNKIVYLKSTPSNTIAVISGGGAGHEPSFASFVGKGILRAAISGSIFASPSAAQIYTCITQRVQPTTGVLVIIMNYTGDVLHFGLATEKARAQGTPVELVVVGDDVGVGRAKSGRVGRRGIAGTVLVHKIAGALAATGASLDKTAELARLVAKNIVSVGSSLDHVHVPGSDEGERMLKDGEMELGMGIHNEQGSKRMPIPEFPKLVELMLAQLLNSDDQDRNYLGNHKLDGLYDGWVLMINNLGGVSPLEMGAITTEVVDQLRSKYNIRPKRVYSGTFMTSLNANGFSISLLRIMFGQGILSLLDAPHETTGWTPSVPSYIWQQQDSPEDDVSFESSSEAPLPSSSLKMDSETFTQILTTALNTLITAEPKITRYDTLVGDGDCGIALRRGAESVLTVLSTPGAITVDPVRSLAHIVTAVEGSTDGTSGALSSIFLNALLSALQNQKHEHEERGYWIPAALQALKDLRRYTPAQPGDRTLMDALQPFLEGLGNGLGLYAAVAKAREGAESTIGMMPKLGRSVYVDNVGDVPDPGAEGVAVFVEGLAEGVRKTQLAS